MESVIHIDKRKYFSNRTKRYYDGITKLLKPYTSSTKGTGEIGGRELGTLIHRQVEEVIKMGYSRTELHSYTKMIFDELIIGGYKIMKSEQIVYNDLLRIATAIDLLVFDVNTSQICAIELKTGYDNMQEKTGRYMKYPFNDIEDTIFNAHSLQLIIGSKMLEETTNLVPERLYILYINKTENSGLREVVIKVPNIMVRMQYLISYWRRNEMVYTKNKRIRRMENKIRNSARRNLS